MKIAECMTQDIEIVTPDQPIQEAARFMLRADAGVMPVSEGDRLVGMVTDRDIAVRAVAEGLGPDTPVRDVMSGDVLFCFEDDEVEAVALKMSDSQVRRMPVLSREDERLVGSSRSATSAARSRAKPPQSPSTESPTPAASIIRAARAEPSDPPHREAMGRGTMRSMVEG